MRVLQLVAEGKISAEDGVRLLEAMREGATSTPSKFAQPGPSCWFRVRVTELATGRDKVNINIPIGLVNVGMKMGARFVGDIEGVRFEDLAAMVQSGRTGKVLDVEDIEDGERVEIFVE